MKSSYLKTGPVPKVHAMATRTGDQSTNLVLGYQPLHKEEGSGNITIPVLFYWNVVNVIFTTMWTATQVVANQNILRKHKI